VDAVPDFSKDPAFILRMMEVNELVPAYIHSLPPAVVIRRQNANKWQPYGKGADVSDAVPDWIVAADKAGVRIER
jgi:hypothetical protein